MCPTVLFYDLCQCYSNTFISYVYSSFPEQAVLFYIRKVFPSATKYSTKELSELDIYIPKFKIGIEYDEPSHKTRVKSDVKKTKTCNDMGIELIRIRDNKLPVINEEALKHPLRYAA